MKILSRLISIILFTIMCLVPIESYAGDFSFDHIKQQGDSFISKGAGGRIVDEGKVSHIMKPIGQFLTGVGVIVLVIATIIMGIKYMSTSDASAQAKIKQQLIGLVVSAIVIFGAYSIWTIVYNFMESITK